jgi:hypothetical protein
VNGVGDHRRAPSTGPTTMISPATFAAARLRVLAGDRLKDGERFRILHRLAPVAGWSSVKPATSGACSKSCFRPEIHYPRHFAGLMPDVAGLIVAAG